METLTLEELGIDKSGIVCNLRATGAMRRRFIDLGVVEGTRIECVGKSPAGDPCAYLVRGAVIAIRAKDARKITLRRSCKEGENGTY